MRGRVARFSHLAHSGHIPRCKSEVKPEIGFGTGAVRGCCENGRGRQERESVLSSAQTFNLQRGFDRVRDRAREEHAWPASNEAADAKNTESLVGQKELIKNSFFLEKKGGGRKQHWRGHRVE